MTPEDILKRTRTSVVRMGDVNSTLRSDDGLIISHWLASHATPPQLALERLRESCPLRFFGVTG